MAAELELKHILWAIDPFITSPTLQIKTLSALRTLTQGLSSQVEPVCVLPPAYPEIPTRLLSRSKLTLPGGPVIQETVPPEQAIRTWAEELSLPNLREPKCLREKTGTLSESVATLLSYAKETGADCIAVSTRARQGFPRLLLGSFAESLILQSEISLFIVNSHSEPTSRFREIVFPTDLSPTSQKAFEKVLRLASLLKIPVTVFHKLFYIDGGEDNFELLREEVQKVEQQLEEWKTRGLKAGIDCVVVTDERPGNIAETILKYANGKKSELIAMSSTAGPLVSAILGSVTRQVARHADCPVLVLNSH